MDISLRHIEVFRAIMQAGSVTGAARLLFTSQPTVSRELARLEALSGLRLFDREGGRLLPTAQAMLLFEEVERAYVGLERINSLAQSMRRFEHGQLSITCLPLFSQTLLPRVCQRFLQAHPGIGLSITAQESPLLEESLSAQRHDLVGIDVGQWRLADHAGQFRAHKRQARRTADQHDAPVPERARTDAGREVGAAECAQRSGRGTMSAVSPPVALCHYLAFSPRPTSPAPVRKAGHRSTGRPLGRFAVEPDHRVAGG